MKNFHFLKLLGILASLLIYSNAANANLIDQGSYFTDTKTNTSWLDLTITSGQSLEQINDRISAGGDLAGWQFATREDYKKLTMTEEYLALFPASNSMPYVGADLAGTLALYFLNTPAPAEFTSPEYYDGVIYGFMGLLKDGIDELSYGYIVKWEYDLFTEIRTSPNSGHLNGAFLIKRQVAEPSALILLMLGILGMLFRHSSMK